MFLREREREIVRVRGGSNGRMGLWEGERIKGKCGERECVDGERKCQEKVNKK